MLVGAGRSAQGFRRRHDGTLSRRHFGRSVSTKALRSLYLGHISGVNVGEMSLMTTRSNLAQRDSWSGGDRDLEAQEIEAHHVLGPGPLLNLRGCGVIPGVN